MGTIGASVYPLNYGQTQGYSSFLALTWAPSAVSLGWKYSLRTAGATTDAVLAVGLAASVWGKNIFEIRSTSSRGPLLFLSWILEWL